MLRYVSRPFTFPGVREKVVQILEDEPRGRILDAGAGEGILSKLLSQNGWDVQACDLYPQWFRKDLGIKCDRVDLNDPLPYPDQKFDAIACVEVIEHLKNPWAVISEFRRVLRNKGVLVLTTPNLMSIDNRISFLFNGEHGLFEHRQLYSEDLDKHLNPMTLPEIHFILRQTNFSVETIETVGRTRQKPIAKFLSISIKPILLRRMKLHFSDEPLYDFFKLLEGKILVVRARAK